MMSDVTDLELPTPTALSAIVWCQSLVVAGALVTVVFGVQAGIDGGWPLGVVVAGVGLIVAVTAGVVGVLSYARWRLSQS